MNTETMTIERLLLTMIEVGTYGRRMPVIIVHIEKLKGVYWSNPKGLLFFGTLVLDAVEKYCIVCLNGI